MRFYGVSTPLRGVVMTFRTLLMVFALLLLLAGRGRTAEVRLRCTADTDISSYETEREFNYGKSTRLRLKGIQMMALFQFDTERLVGWQVKRATLYLRYAGNDRKLRTLGLSTITVPWEEGTGTGERKLFDPCFNWSACNQTRWAGPYSDFTDVSFTGGNSLANYADVTVLPDGWISVPVEPRLVHAMILGYSFGLAVSDEKGQTGANNDVYSREQSGSEPYLVVEGAPGPRTAPAVIDHPTISADSSRAGYDTGGVQVSFLAPFDDFAYEVRYSQQGGQAQTLPHLDVPFAQPGKQQTIHIGGLKPTTPVVVEIVPISASGVRGTPTRVTGIASSALLKPPILRRPASPAGAGEAPHEHGGRMRLWAYPDTEKAHPSSGNLLEEVGSKGYNQTAQGDYRSGNAVWDGRMIRLYAARNEFVAFH